MIVFFPSYAGLNHFKSICEKHATLQVLSNIKELFWETNASTETSQLLDAFMAACDDYRQKGALLFAVINGKISEGINFSHHYGR